MSQIIITVIKFYKFSNTQSVLSTKYVYILSKNAQENRLIKSTTKAERTLLVLLFELIIYPFTVNAKKYKN